MKTNMKAAVVALVRGYKELDKYDDLLRRNSGIFKHINSKLAYPLKLILFHEGNISSDHQNYILSNSPEDIEFINVSSEFSFNKNIVKTITNIAPNDDPSTLPATPPSMRLNNGVKPI